MGSKNQYYPIQMNQEKSKKSKRAGNICVGIFKNTHFFGAIRCEKNRKLTDPRSDRRFCGR